MRDDNCIFCKLANGDIPTATLYEGADTPIENPPKIRERQLSSLNLRIGLSEKNKLIRQPISILR